MAVGNIMALSQTNIKRMLAYSSIAHAGYALVGLAQRRGRPDARDGAASVMLYVCIYALMNMGAFGVVIMLRKAGERGEEITDFAGLGKTNKTAAFLMLIFMFSLTGIPPTAGFIGKFYIFKSAVQSGLVWLAVAGVIFSSISAYFYLRVIMVMYMKEPKETIELTTLAVPRACPGDIGDRRDLHRRPSLANCWTMRVLRYRGSCSLNSSFLYR